MGHTYLTRRWGAGTKDPSIDQMRSALAELAVKDDEHPDCSLSDETGWTLSAFAGGTLVFENVETGEGPWHLPSVQAEVVVDLWLKLQVGDLPAVQRQPWEKGYG